MPLWPRQSKTLTAQFMESLMPLPVWISEGRGLMCWLLYLIACWLHSDFFIHGVTALHVRSRFTPRDPCRRFPPLSESFQGNSSPRLFGHGGDVTEDLEEMMGSLQHRNFATLELNNLHLFLWWSLGLSILLSICLISLSSMSSVPEA